MPKLRTGGQILVDQLVAQGVAHVFCVPGESYLAVLDALHDAPIALTVCRQEAGAGIMAEAAARLTGRPGVVFVTRGPGATNAAHAIHIAEQGGTPLIMFIGQVDRGMSERGAFQEMDYRAFFGSTTKWATQIEDPARIPEIVSRAFHVALQGRPGPVVIALPEDMLVETASVADAHRVESLEIWPGPPQMHELHRTLCAAERPIILLGGTGWREEASQSIMQFAEGFDLPVAASFRRASLFPNDHQCYAGEIGIGPNPKLRRRMENADVVLLIGGRMGEAPSQGYEVLDIPTPRQKLVHVHADATEIGRVYHPFLGIVATPCAFAAATKELRPPATIGWRAERQAARADYLAWTQPPPPGPGPVDLTEIFVHLRDKLAENTIITNGAGNFALWVGRFLRFHQFGSHLGPVSGSMGYGLPAAVGAKRVRPDHKVVCFCGDGDFLMNGQEFATAVQYDLAIVVIIIDNGMYGTIRMHQERRYPGRIEGTALRNPDFAAYARAFGGHGETVEATDEFAPAFERSLASKKPSIIHINVDPEAITPTLRLSELGKKGSEG